LRAAAWSIDESSSPRDVVRKLRALQSHDYWDLLKSGSTSIDRLDFSMCYELGSCVRRKAEAAPAEVADPLTIAEVERLLRIWFPDVTHAHVCKLLLRAEKRRVIARAKRGVYVEDKFRSFQQHREEEEFYETERWQKFEQRLHRDASALILHYLLPKVSAYRKASALAMSERNFYYGISRTIDSVFGSLEDERAARRMEVRRALGY
jgi:hypothetical protein